MMYEQLVAAFEPIRTAARAALTHRQQAWPPVAEQIHTWAATARNSQHGKKMHSALQEAIGWMQKVADDIRNAQLKPVAGAATAMWDTLRQESNVNLDGIRPRRTETAALPAPARRRAPHPQRPPHPTTRSAVVARGRRRLHPPRPAPSTVR